MRSPTSQLIYASGRLEVDLAQRELRMGGTPVPIGGRAFEIIEVLVQAAGALVTKDDLMERVWPGAIVEENTLQVHISAVRKALGSDRFMLKTQKGRGYRLLGTWNVSPGTTPIDALGAGGAPGPSIVLNNLPVAETDLIGRAEAMQQLRDLLSAYRMITLTGPGGIGKTKLAVETARHLVAQGPGEIWLVELASLSDPELVPSAVANALGLRLGVPDLSGEVIARALAQRQMLLMLDNCEHIVDAVAMFAETMLRLCPHATILATSREVLRIDGEYVYRVPSLDVPHREDAPGDIAKRSAVQLFVARTTAMNAAFVPSATTLPEVADICQHLDGIPLAIEFAAARAGMIGVSQVAAQLDDRFNLLTAGRRTALARHQTLRATLDWSFDLLTVAEQRFFRALGIFTGGFAVEAAAAVAIDAADPAFAAVDRLADLVAKSLVVADVNATKPRFRLLDTTRAYAIETFDESGERQRLARRHAEYYCNLFERAEAEARARPTGEWLADYACEIDNMRAALDWAFAPGGDGSIGATLTTAAVPLWMHLSLLEERRRRAKQALGVLGTGATPRQEMRLHDALGKSASEAPEMEAAYTKELHIANSLEDAEYQLRALHGLYFCYSGSGRYRAALQFAQEFHDLAMRKPDGNARVLGERMMGAAKHFLGDQISARRHLEHALTLYEPTDPRRGVTRFATDMRVIVRVFYARVLWLQGHAEAAVRTAEVSVAEAQEIGHAMSLCYALALAACPIALWVGNPTTAAHYTGMLVDQSSKHGLSLLSTFAARFQRVVALQGGDLATGSRPLRISPEEIVDPNVSFGILTGLTEQAEALGHAGRIGEGLALLEAGLAHSETGWLTPELLRLKGELWLLRGTPAAMEPVEDLFRQALDAARRQEALSWQLRAATSLARLLRGQGRAADAIACLRPIHERFTEGFGTADLIAAKQLLDELANARP